MSSRSTRRSGPARTAEGDNTAERIGTSPDGWGGRRAPSTFSVHGGGGGWEAETRPGSQRPPPRLLALDGLEQRLEVALAEASRAVPLDDLEEQRRPVLHRLGEDLQQVTLFVAIDQDAQLGQLPDVLVDLADALGEHVVVGARHAQERHVAVAHRADRLDDVPRRHGDVLHARPAVEL